MRVLLVGYGNEFRQDDRVGHVLAPRIAEWLGGQGVDTELWLGAQLLPELADDMTSVDLAVFVDASTVELPGGFSFDEIVPDPSLEGLNIHSMGPSWLLSLMDDLGYRKPKTLLISVTGVSFDFSDDITDECAGFVDSAEAAFKEWWAQA
ncbi:hydrogenase maturation protease [Dethiosulfovibrio sp. F2B]|uniref:hydrogenase maturation protease n=1 Tax=Dethiosulfovibrio faecalis TaxID=2720018 RepID=UPI001F316C84|nr:hydrogenase maturation protease [Dethiosulfovibrio faecalis]MCF4152476.1 hydrogenase maturation protease [Dethiosulfovibrio faecalis]